MKNISKKKLAGILTAIATIATIIASILNGGCAAIKNRNIANDLEDWTGRAKAVCTTVEAFDAVGLEAPGVEQCKEVVKAIDGIYYEAIYDVASCVQDNNLKSQDFATCVASVEEWDEIARRIASKL